MVRDMDELYENYFCSSRGCEYRTTAGNEKETVKQLMEDGGFDIHKVTKCPICQEDSLVYLNKE